MLGCFVPFTGGGVLRVIAPVTAGRNALPDLKEILLCHFRATSDSPSVRCDARLPGLALSATASHPLVQDDPDAACDAAIESQVWEDVIAACEPLLSVHDESHSSWEFYKENVEYAHTSINYANQTQCVESAQAAAWDTTLTACPATLEVNPDFFAGHLFLGFAHQAKGNATEAMSSFEKFLAGTDTNPEMAAQLGDQIAMARRNVALGRSESGDRAAAIPLLRQVAAADPTDVEIHFRLGFALLQEEDTAGAEEAFSVVIAQNPDIPQLSQVLYRAASINFNARDYDKAGPRLTSYLEAEPEGEYVTEAHWMLGFIAQLAQDQRGVMRHYGRRAPGRSQRSPGEGGQLLAGRDHLQRGPVQHRAALLQRLPEARG